MNSITDEYGKYFKIVSYEVWNDSNNSKLLTDVSTFLGQPAGGVPYIVIGDKVFAGYATQYDESIKTTIKELYNTKKNKRYDVMAEMKKKDGDNSSISNSSLWIIIICNVACTVVGALAVMSHFNKKYTELYQKLDEIKNTKVTTEKAKKK